jgi:hypothetical protein
MGRANQPIRPINTQPMVQAMLHASGLRVEAGRAWGEALKGVGASIGNGLLQVGQRKERQKDRNLQREMQEKNQRLGWARLQFDKQTSLLNQLDDDLKTAEADLQSQAALFSAPGAGNQQGLQAAQQRVDAVRSRQEAVKAGLYQTQQQTGVRPSFTETAQGMAARASGGVERYEMDDCYGGT